MVDKARPFVGREKELAQIRTSLVEAAEGNGRLVAVEGDAGVGKSALVTRVVERASGFEVHLGVANELEGEVPFALLARVFSISSRSPNRRCREIASMITAPAEGGRVDHRFRIIEEIVDLVEALAVRSPRLVVVEDLQWADSESAAALVRVGERVEDLPLLLLCTQRPTQRDVAEQLARTTLHPVRVSVLPLTKREVGELASILLDATIEGNLEESLEAAAGNPLFIEELLAALGRDGALIRTDGRVGLTSSTAPPSLRLVILRRVTQFPATTVDLLRTGAVMGAPFSAEELGLIHDLSTVEVIRSLQDAVRSGVLTDDGEGMRFRHDLFREAIYEDISVSIRRSMHRHIAATLIDRGYQPHRLLTHITKGVLKSDHQGATWLRAAAREVAGTSVQAAVELYERALALASADFAPRVEIETELITTLVWGGEPARGEALARDLLTSPSLNPNSRSTIATALVRAIMLQGKHTDLRRELEAITRDETVPESARAILLAEASLNASGSRKQHSEAIENANQSLALASRGSIPAARCTAFCALSYIHMYLGDIDRAIDFAQEAVEIAQGSHDPDTLRRAPNYYLASTLMFVDEVAEAERLYVEGMQLAEELSAPWSLPVYHLLLSEVQRLTGRWDDMVASCEAGIRLAEHLGTVLQVIPAHTNIALAHVHRGEFAQAQDHLAACDAMIGSAPRPYHAEWARAVLLNATGDDAGAMAVAATLHDELTASEHWFMYRLVGMDLVRMFAAGGRSNEADEVAQILERLVPRRPASSPRAVALHAQALATNDPATAVEAYDVYRESPLMTDAAWAAEDAAVIISGSDEGRAIELLQEAARSHEKAGLSRHAARVDARLRRFGVRRGTHDSRRKATTGWPSLTRSELKVTELVAEGLSNAEVADRLYISRRTVDAHLSHIYTKLAISSRTQLAAQFARRNA